MHLSMAYSPPPPKTLRLTNVQVRAALRQAATRFAERPNPERPLVLTGLMGVGKTTVGRRLASVLKVKFIDSDMEIERVSCMRIGEIFDRFGEPYFRNRERAVIERLLGEGPGVIALGGGAFADAMTRALVLERGLVVWLRAPIDVLVERTGRRDTRPLLKNGDPRTILTDLLARREAAYAQAPIHCNSGLGRLDWTVLTLLNRVNKSLFGASARLKRRRRSKTVSKTLSKTL